MNSRQRRARRARQEGVGAETNDPTNHSNNVTNIDDIKETTMAHASDSTYVISPPRPPKRTQPVLIGGAGRGARQNLPAYAEFNRDSAAVELVPVLTDPLPGRALALKEEAERQGIKAGAIEGRIEGTVTAIAGASNDPFVLNLDRASGTAAVLRDTRSARRPVLGYLLVRLPRRGLLGLRYVLEADDTAARDGAIAFFEELAHVSERNTSDAILGERADPAHTLAEPAIRRWFAEHTKANLGKLVAGLEPTTNTFEVTADGRETLALVVVVRGEWSDPAALAEQVVASPSVPIRRGMRFMIAEVVANEGIRIHDVRRRTDDRVTVGRAEVIDQAAMDAVRREELERQMTQALARAERETLSRRNPVQTTD